MEGMVEEERKKKKISMQKMIQNNIGIRNAIYVKIFSFR